MANPPPKKNLRRRIRRSLIGAALTALVYVAGAVHFFNTTSGIERDYFDEMNARHANLSESDRAWPVYESARNAWFDVAAPLKDRIAAYYSEQKQRELHDPLYDSPPDPFTSKENPFQVPRDHPFYEDALAALEAYQPHLAAIRQAAQRPACALPVTDNWTTHPDDDLRNLPLPPTSDLREREPVTDLYLPQLGNMRHAARMLAFDSTAAAARRDGDTLVANFEAIIGLARHCHGEPMLMSSLIALSNLEIASRGVMAVVHADPGFLTDEQLGRLGQRATEAAETLAYVEFDDEERAQQEVLDRAYTHDAGGDGLISYDGLRMMYAANDREPPHPVVLAFYWPARHRIAGRAAQQSVNDDAFAAIADLEAAGPSGLPAFYAARAEIEQKESGSRRHAWRPSTLLGAYAKASLTPHITRTRLQATATRLALERHKLAQCHYPQTLAQLVPTYLPELPADPFNPGHPIKYLLRDDQPILYSVGANAVDDHATPAPAQARTRVDSLEVRFANPDSPSPEAPKADWILYPPQD
jgi:hypothetical protein